MPKITREKFRTFQDVFDRFTIRNIFKLVSQNHFDEDTLSPVSIGKEANIFSAIKGNSKVILKIHRLETSDFNRMYYYIKDDPRFAHVSKKRREIIFAWSQREYRNLLAAREAGLRIPLPITFLKNIIVMEFIGNESPAPMLKDRNPENPEKFFKDVVENIKKYYRKGYVHGDLSKFNILNHNNKPVLIDFSHGTPKRNPNFEELLERDVKNTSDYFRKRGMKIKDENVLKQIRK